MTETTEPRGLELLAPARDAEIAIAAINHGADAIYIGAPTHSARAAAGVTVSEIGRVADHAHRFGARVYVALNTIIYPDELKSVERTVGELYRAGADALIVQDMALLGMDLPPIALHASTQCDIRTPDRARFLEACGFSQIVVARELTLSETADIAASINVPIEAFVHGALCVSYSGACYASLAATGRSANRGECAQLCRLPYELLDERGHTLMAPSHLLSLRDLNRSAQLGEMAAAGVSSFKIEGRLKDADYVKNVTAAYRRALDELIDANQELYRRTSSGRSAINFTPDLTRSFNRGFTDYFTTARRPDSKMASMRSPKWLGNPIGKVTATRRGVIEIKSLPGVTLANGDGLGFFDSTGEFRGFRVNRVEGARVFPATADTLPPVGTTLLRNRDKAWDDLLAASAPRRVIDVSLTLRITPRGIAIDATDTDGHAASVAEDMELPKARTSQAENRRKILEKAGDTEFSVTSVTDTAGDTFIPASALTSLRREVLAKLVSVRHTTYKFDRRRPMSADLKSLLTATGADASLNIANNMAEGLYRQAGMTNPPHAPEVSPTPPANGDRLMTTRYCLRREMGRCLKTPRGKEWPQKLLIRSGQRCFALEFDCKKCEMHVNYIAKPDNFS